MIRVHDPTTVSISLSVKDAAALRGLVQRATGAAVGVVFTDEQKMLWEQFCAQVEKAEKIQRSIWSQLYAGPAASAEIETVVEAAEPKKLSLWERLWRA